MRPIGGVAGRPSWSRRQFLQAAGLGALTLGAAACGTSAGTASAGKAAPGTRFRSRPDLNPPPVTVTTRSTDLAPGLIFVTVGGPLILDNDGRPVWYQTVKGKTATDLRVQQYRGEPVLTWWEGTVSHTGHGSGEGVLADATYSEITRVRAGGGLSADLHELTVTPEGTALITIFSPHQADLSAVGGPRRGTLLDSLLQEIDIATGQVLFEWRASDHVALTESHAKPEAGVPFDFFHINSINLDTDGNLLVSARNTWAVYKVDRRTGAVYWRLGGKKTDYAMGPATVFAWQHDANRQDDGSITLFDDEDAPRVGSQSRGLVLRLDDSAMTARLDRQYRHPSPLLAGSQGSVEVLPGGNVFIGWGAEPYFSEFSADGRLLYDAHFAGKSQSYRAFRSPWVGRPPGRPALAVARPSGSSLTAYASWNGATEVAGWRLLTGPTADGLQPGSSTPRSGFETAIPVSGPAAYVAVAALDSTGSTLGVSATVRP